MPVRATEKITAFGVHGLAAAMKIDLASVYRYRRWIETGKGVPDKIKRRMVEATAGSDHAIRYADFFPDEPAEAAA